MTHRPIAIRNAGVSDSGARAGRRSTSLIVHGGLPNGWVRSRSGGTERATCQRRRLPQRQPAVFRQRMMAVRVSGAAGVPVPARRNANACQDDHAMRPPRTVSSSVTSARGWSYQGGRSRNPTGSPGLGRAGNRSSHAIYPASTRIRAAMQPQRPMSSPCWSTRFKRDSVRGSIQIVTSQPR